MKIGLINHLFYYRKWCCATSTAFGGSGEYFGDNDAHLDIINVFYQEASGGKYLPRAVLFDLEPGAIDALRASSLCCLIRPEKIS